MPRCTACDDVIGVYEPLVHTLGRSVRRTSRAVEPGVFASEGECYHLDCYECLVGEP
jgi:phage major head subunit gpT-like protein